MKIYFDNWTEISPHLVNELEEKIEHLNVETRQAYASESPSGYLYVTFLDEEGDRLAKADGDDATYKIRFSNHDQVYEADLSIEFNRMIQDHFDEDDESIFINCSLEATQIEAMVSEAADFILQKTELHQC